MQFHEAHGANVIATVSPLLDGASIAVTSADPDEARERLSEVARCSNGQPPGCLPVQLVGGRERVAA